MSIRKRRSRWKIAFNKKIAKVCYLLPSYKLRKWMNCKYPEYILCPRTHSKNLSTNRLPVVYLLFVKLWRRRKKEKIKNEIIYFLPFWPFGSTFALSLMFHWRNCPSRRDVLNIFPTKHKLSPSANINLSQNVHATRKIVLN